MESTNTTAIITVPVTLPTPAAAPKDDGPTRLTYTRREAAAALGVSVPTIDTLIRRADHPLPCIRLGTRGRGKVLISSQALAEWIAEEANRNSGTATKAR